MSILIDYNHIFLANIFAQKQFDINEDLVRHTVLSCLLSYKKQFAKEYGKIILCADGKNYWRKEVFPYYKANRKKQRSDTNINWATVFESLAKIRNEIKEKLPFHLIEVESLEADDIIATLVKSKSEDEKILILSGDHDFIQLQIYPNVFQYSPIQKKKVVHDDPKQFLKEKILRGDTGDGVPNFLSDDDTFILSDKRQKPLRAKILEEYLQKPIEEYEPNLLKNYERNKKVVSLIDDIPEHLEKQVFEQLNEDKNITVKDIMNYFMKSGLKNLMEHLTEFKE